MSYEIEFEKRALQELYKLNQIVFRRILKGIKGLEEGFDSKDVKRLKGREGYRLRVGDYRIIFEVEHELIKILKIGHRKNIYKSW